MYLIYTCIDPRINSSPLAFYFTKETPPLNIKYNKFDSSFSLYSISSLINFNILIYLKIKN